MSFEIYNARLAGAELTQKVYSLPNTLYAFGDMGYLVNGQFTQVVAGSKGTHILQAMITPASVLRPANSPANQYQTTGLAEFLEVVPIFSNAALWIKTFLTGNSAPVINGLACNANANVNNVLFTFGGATGDWVGGVIYCVEFGQWRLITVDAVAGGVHTVTLNTPFTQGQNQVAATTGNTIIAVPFGPGTVGIQYNATVPQQGINVAVAGKTGGYLKCEEVHLDERVPYVLLSAPYLQ